MQLRQRSERCERCPDNDIRSDRDVVQPFYDVVLAVLQRPPADDFCVEAAGAFACGLEVLWPRGADVDPDRDAEFREVVFGSSGAGGGVPDVVEERSLFVGHLE